MNKDWNYLYLVSWGSGINGLCNICKAEKYYLYSQQSAHLLKCSEPSWREKKLANDRTYNVGCVEVLNENQLTRSFSRLIVFVGDGCPKLCLHWIMKSCCQMRKRCVHRGITTRLNTRSVTTSRPCSCVEKVLHDTSMFICCTISLTQKVKMPRKELWRSFRLNGLNHLNMNYY